MSDTSLTPSQKQRRYRSRLSRQGLRPVQIWVPDTRAANFVEECRKQALLIAGGTKAEGEVMAFIEDVADWDDK